MFRVLCVIVTLMATSCYSWTKIREAPPGSDAVASASEVSEATAACISGTRPGDDTDAFVIAFREKLAAAAVFSDVRMSRCDADATVLNLVRVVETDPHVTRMVLTSMSFIVYAIPTLIPYRYDYSEEVALEAVSPDDSVRHYRSRVDGSQYHTIWAGFQGPRREVRDAVKETVVNDLVNQLVRDRQMFGEKVYPENR